MATYDAYTNTASSGNAPGTVTFIDGRGEHARSEPVRTQHTASGAGYNYGGVNLSPEQAVQMGLVPAIEGKTAEQALRQHELNAFAQSRGQQAPAVGVTENQRKGQALREHFESLGIVPKAEDATAAEHQQPAADAAQQAVTASHHIIHNGANPDEFDVMPSHYEPNRIDEDGARLLGQFGEYFSTTEQSALLNMAIEGTEPDQSTLASLVSNHGMQHPDELRANIAAAFSVHEEAFNRYATDRGVDHEGFREWLRENHSKETSRLAREQYRTGDPRVWSHLVTGYAASSAMADPELAMDALKEAGIPAWKTGKTVVANVDGVEMKLADAFRFGLLSARFD
ncbi:MAG: hypothetical protein KDJ27_03900 [Gammaproteobacteria bacterium]|nr:hypothetical protein [Gammaproteobacteria bacterium]